MIDKKDEYYWLKMKIAIDENNIDEVQRLISQTDINSQIISKALFFASSYGHLSMVQMLIAAGANINGYFFGGTILTEAVCEGHIEVVKLLLRAVADTSLPHWRESPPPLTVAASKGHMEIVKLLIEFGANVNQTDSGDCAINAAAGAGYEEIFDFLSPLSNKELREKALQVLPKGIRERELEKNADPNVVKLINIILRNIIITETDIKEIREIINAGININGLGDTGCTALFYAVTKNDYSITKIFLEAGADPNLENEIEIDEHETALMRAKDIEICSLLIDFDADKNKKNQEGESALIIAISESNIEKVRFLIQAGADINTIDNQGNNALIIAKEKDNAEIIQILIDARAVV